MDGERGVNGYAATMWAASLLVALALRISDALAVL
jgi:hypothetical protein